MTETLQKNTLNWREARSAPMWLCLIWYALALLAAAASFLMLQDSLSPVWNVFVADIVATFVIFLSSRVTQNSSMYDPYWSVLPIVLVSFWLLYNPSETTIHIREWIALIFVWLWGLRLTFNCMRRWQNMQEIDFRYIMLKENSGMAWPFVDLMGIHVFPTIQVFLGLLPVLLLAGFDTPLNIIDGLAILIFLASLAIETIADEQLHKFKKHNTDPEKVCTEGLWGWSQHPNYIGENLFWISLFVLALAASPDLWWTLIGVIAMLVMFIFASLPLILTHKRKKRPSYNEQVKGISVFFPRPRRKG